MDQLTGVKNRNAYEDALKELRKDSIPAGIIMADVNGLKERNDSLGHHTGDQIIEDTASFLCTLTHEDLPYRIGGDEFVLLFRNCSPDKIEKKLHLIRTFSEASVSCGGA